MSFRVTFSGFESAEQAIAFADWYEGQGEQDAVYWFEARIDDENLDVRSMYTNISESFKWQGATLHMVLDMEYVK